MDDSVTMQRSDYSTGTQVCIHSVSSTFPLMYSQLGLSSSSRPKTQNHPHGSEAIGNGREYDLAHRIKGLFRLLYIYGEEGSGGIGKLAFP